MFKKPENEYVSIETIEARERRAAKIATAKFICVKLIAPIVTCAATVVVINKLDKDSDKESSEA